MECHEMLQAPFGLTASVMAVTISFELAAAAQPTELNVPGFTQPLSQQQTTYTLYKHACVHIKPPSAHQV